MPFIDPFLLFVHRCRDIVLGHTCKEALHFSSPPSSLVLTVPRSTLNDTSVPDPLVHVLTTAIGLFVVAKAHRGHSSGIRLATDESSMKAVNERDTDVVDVDLFHFAVLLAGLFDSLSQLIDEQRISLEKI